MLWFVRKLRPVFDTSFIFSNFLSFCLFIFRKHISFPWIWNHKFHDFPYSSRFYVTSSNPASFTTLFTRSGTILTRTMGRQSQIKSQTGRRKEVAYSERCKFIIRVSKTHLRNCIYLIFINSNSHHYLADFHETLIRVPNQTSQ